MFEDQRGNVFWECSQKISEIDHVELFCLKAPVPSYLLKKTIIPMWIWRDMMWHVGRRLKRIEKKSFKLVQKWVKFQNNCLIILLSYYAHPILEEYFVYTGLHVMWPHAISPMNVESKHKYVVQTSGIELSEKVQQFEKSALLWFQWHQSLT